MATTQLNAGREPDNAESPHTAVGEMPQRTAAASLPALPVAGLVYGDPPPSRGQDGRNDADPAGRPAAQGRRTAPLSDLRRMSSAKSPDEGEVATNTTGMPDHLKSGLEQLSGLDLSGVQVRYHSVGPARWNARAYTQGDQIHLGPGQERHLPHEGWHVVQQMQGRVPASVRDSTTSINVDPSLEREANSWARGGPDRGLSGGGWAARRGRSRPLPCSERT